MLAELAFCTPWCCEFYIHMAVAAGYVCITIGSGSLREKQISSFNINKRGSKNKPGPQHRSCHTKHNKHVLSLSSQLEEATASPEVVASVQTVG